MGKRDRAAAIYGGLFLFPISPCLRIVESRQLRRFPHCTIKPGVSAKEAQPIKINDRDHLQARTGPSISTGKIQCEMIWLP